MKNLFVFLVVIAFIGCGKNDPAPVVNHSWIEDIQYMQQELPARHVNLFSNITQQEFNSEIEDLIEIIPQLEEHEIICNTMKILAKIGDSHTGIHNKYTMRRFNMAPLKFEHFSDGIYIVGIAESGKDYLKQKVVAINDVPIDIVQEKLATVFPHENEYLLKVSTPIYLRLYEILKALGVSESKSLYHITLDNGETVRISGNTPVDLDLSSCYSPENTPLYLQNNHINYWYKIIGENIVYLQYNRCLEMSEITFEKFCQQLFAEIESLEIDKFIVDLRLNPGGSSVVMSPLISELKKHENLKGKIYACIGCKTFSSGLINALQLKEELGAVLVGEPTGGKPNHFGEVRQLILPNSELRVGYSTKQFVFYPQSNLNTLEPDFFVANNSGDSFAGIDSYVEFIKKE